MNQLRFWEQQKEIFLSVFKILEAFLRGFHKNLEDEKIFPAL